jgi:hypothetical protein
MKLAPSGGRILKRGSRPIFAIDSARSRSSVMARHVGREWFLIPADNADDDEYAPSDEERHGADRDQHQDDLPGHGHDHGSCGQSVGAIIIMALAPNFMQEASNNPILSYPQILNNTLRCCTTYSYSERPTACLFANCSNFKVCMWFKFVWQG